MVLEYKNNQRFEELAPVVEDYMSWYSQLSFYVLYPDGNVSVTIPPNTFNEWSGKVMTKDEVNPEVLDDIIRVYDEMIVASEKIVGITSDTTKPDKELFKKFRELYLSFLIRMRRLEKDSAMEGRGIDHETGLRVESAIMLDAKREMQRLSRQGVSFTLAMGQIDNLTRYNDQKEVLQYVVKTLQDCLRPFDDAYYTQEGFIVLNLKHTDITGAECAVNRLRDDLVTKDDDDFEVTMTFSMFEPAIGDDIEFLLSQIKQDILGNTNKKDKVLRFKEVSELDRYLETLKTESNND